MSTLSVQTITDVRSFDFANTEFAGAYDAANLAVATANVAVATANAALPNVSNAVFAGDLRVTGNLQIGTNTVTIRDNHIISAEYYRMNTANHMVVIPDGNRVNTIFSLVNVSFDTANASYNSANNVGPQLAPAFNTANAAFGKANTALQNTSGTFAGNLNVSGNLDLSLSTSHLKIPIGTTAQRPTGTTGVIRYNNVINALEYYNGSIWVNPIDGIISTPAYAASGGTITTSGNWRIHTFTSSGSITFSTAGRIQLLIVAGGGAGGYDVPGGGGAGGAIYSAAFPVDAATYTVTVGAGAPSTTYSTTRGATGSNSVFGSLISYGGGGGGSWNYQGPSEGGCGGGADGQDVYRTRSGARSSHWRDQYQYCITYGNRGGNGGGSADSYATGGGGGGIGRPGGNGDLCTGGPAPWNGITRVADGGDGLPFDISGSTTWYGGGGNGSSNDNTARGNGGQGGGGTGGGSGGAGGVNTGGGGGSNGALTSGVAGGAGGSGIVIIRYLT